MVMGLLDLFIKKPLKPEYQKEFDGRTEIVEEEDGYFIADLYKTQTDNNPMRVEVHSIGRLIERNKEYNKRVGLANNQLAT